MDYNRDDEQYASEQPRRKEERVLSIKSDRRHRRGRAHGIPLCRTGQAETMGKAKKSTSQRLGGEQVKTVNVNVNDAVTNMVSRVSDSVVGVLNIQKTDIWGEGGEAGSGSGVIYKRTETLLIS